MTQSTTATEDHLLHSALTRDVIGCVFEAFKSLGFGYQERYYQRAVAIELQESGLSFQREQYQRLMYKGRILGQYYMDFVIDSKVVLELKIANEFFDTHINQVLGYLRATELKVGLLAIVTKDGVKIKRVVN